MLSIEYDHDDFPPGKLVSSGSQLAVTWDEFLWAAITVGRPNLYHVFRHGRSSIYEAIFRWSLIRMSLEQRGLLGTRFYRPAAFKNMDPTEKGAVNYFLGLVVCKLFAAKLLNAPWCLHLDIWRPLLNPVLLAGRSRPDMVAQSALSSEWYAFESKGRASIPNEGEKVKAKAQANRIVSVGGANCALHVGSIAYFRGDVLKFYWRDPEPRIRKRLEIPEPEDAWQEYYEHSLKPFEIFSVRQNQALRSNRCPSRNWI